MRFDDFYDDYWAPCPWYIIQMMDQDMVHLTVQDLSDPEQFPEQFVDDEEKKVPSDFIVYLLSPCFLRARGVNPEGLYSLREFKEKAMSLIKDMAPVELRSSTGLFRKRIQGFLNETLNLLFNSNSLDEAKSLVREILCLLGVDYPLEAITEEDVALYNTSYIFPVKIFHALGLFDPEEFRYENLNSNYLKKVPEPTLWDFRDFLEMEAKFIASTFYKSFLISKQDPSDRRWVELYNEAEKSLSLVERLFFRVPSIAARNQKKEVWVLSTHDFFFLELRKKILALAEEIPQGLREEFIEFYLPEDVNKRLNPRVVYRPWVKK